MQTKTHENSKDNRLPYFQAQAERKREINLSLTGINNDIV